MRVQMRLRKNSFKSQQKLITMHYVNSCSLSFNKFPTMFYVSSKSRLNGKKKIARAPAGQFLPDTRS